MKNLENVHVIKKIGKYFYEIKAIEYAHLSNNAETTKNFEGICL